MFHLLRDAEGAPNLRLLSYNIWGLPGWMTGARSGRYPQIARELERLNPDIILLQEAWTAKARKSAPATGSWWTARAARQHTFFQQTGFDDIVQFPIIGGEFLSLLACGLSGPIGKQGSPKTTTLLARRVNTERLERASSGGGVRPRPTVASPGAGLPVSKRQRMAKSPDLVWRRFQTARPRARSSRNCSRHWAPRYTNLVEEETVCDVE